MTWYDLDMTDTEHSAKLFCGLHILWHTQAHFHFTHIHSENIQARCRARCKVCILAIHNVMTESIIEMAVCFFEKSQMALPHAIKQPAKELWLPFSPSTSACTIRTFVWLNTCWRDYLHSSQLSRKRVLTDPVIAGDPVWLAHNLWASWVPELIQWEGYVTPMMKKKLFDISHHVEMDLSDLWSHCSGYSQKNQAESTGWMITNARQEKVRWGQLI